MKVSDGTRINEDEIKTAHKTFSSVKAVLSKVAIESKQIFTKQFQRTAKTGFSLKENFSDLLADWTTDGEDGE
jgi:hypothetical protein